jgi:hypothetical protein
MGISFSDLIVDIAATASSASLAIIVLILSAASLALFNVLYGVQIVMVSGENVHC